MPSRVGRPHGGDVEGTGERLAEPDRPPEATIVVAGGVVGAGPGRQVDLHVGQDGGGVEAQLLHGELVQERLERRPRLALARAPSFCPPCSWSQKSGNPT